MLRLLLLTGALCFGVVSTGRAQASIDPLDNLRPANVEFSASSASVPRQPAAA